MQGIFHIGYSVHRNGERVAAVIVARFGVENIHIIHGQVFNPLMYDYLHMSIKSVRLDEEVYERIAAHKRDDETFSEAIDRLTSDYSFLAFAGGASAEEADRHRELLAEADATAREDRRERLQRLGVDTE